MKRVILQLTILLCILLLHLALFGCANKQGEAPAAEVPLVFTHTPAEEDVIAVPTFTLPMTNEGSATALKPTLTIMLEATSERSLPPSTLTPKQTPVVPIYAESMPPTFTPDPTRECPPTVLNNPIVLPSPEGEPIRTFETILDYVNAGGSIDQVQSSLKNQHGFGNARLKEVTGDDYPEIFLHLVNFHLLKCKNGQYVEEIRVPPEHTTEYPSSYIEDLNRNGFIEIMITTNRNAEYDGIVVMRIFEWDGKRFVSRLPNYINHPYSDKGLLSINDGVLRMLFLTPGYWDKDLDGILEIQLNGGDNELFESAMLKWDGQYFSLDSVWQEEDPEWW